MNEEIVKTEEVKAVDNPDATLASPEASVTPNLDNTPTPTVEEKQEAGIDATATAPSENVEPENPAPVEENPTPAAEAPVPAVEENGVTETPARMFTQSQVDDIAGKTRTETRDKTFRYIYDRYGVKDEAELDALIGTAQSFDSYKEQVEADKAAAKADSDARDKELADIKEQVALMQSGIDNARYDDAKLILRGKGLEVSLENINNELATHPEWKKVEAPVAEEKPFVKAEPVSKINVLGNEPAQTKGPESEEEKAMRMFRV